MRGVKASVTGVAGAPVPGVGINLGAGQLALRPPCWACAVVRPAAEQHHMWAPVSSRVTTVAHLMGLQCHHRPWLTI